MSVYDMDYLEKLTKLDMIANKVKFELDTDNPLRVTFEFVDNIEFLFLMAPLETGDEDEDFDDED